MSYRKLLLPLFLLALIAALSLLPAAAKDKKKDSAGAIGTMEQSKRALHALNRLTFGPRPGEVEEVQKMGLEKWIELQLNPEKIDDSRLEERLAPLRALKMSTAELVENFPTPQMLRAVADGKQPMPSNPTERAVYESAIARMQAQQQRKAEAGNNQEMVAPQPVSANSTNAEAAAANDSQRDAAKEARMYAQLEVADLLELPPDQRYAAIMNLPPEQRQKLGQAMANDEQMVGDLNPQQRETLLAMSNPQQVVVTEAQQGKLLRAAYSERQFEEVMTDFWFNHFNIYVNKGPERYSIVPYERDVIRLHLFGKFKDLLLATAQSPAMLYYLDNWQSVGPDSAVAMGLPAHPAIARNPRRGPHVDRYGRLRIPLGPASPRPAPGRSTQKNQKRLQRTGLNENYAREIMELHTLGVDGGYTQSDVTELAKILTGWTISEPRRGASYEFNQRMHQPGDKHLLGHTIHEDGENEGKKVIAMLAANPATARFISRKLAMRFVADDPPKALVDRMAATYLKTDGDIREVLRTLFRSPEFWSADDYRAKVKTPFEFVVSAVRATAANVTEATPMVQALNRMGMPLYAAQPPTGYSMKAATWVNSAALLSRMNFALALGNGKLRSIQPDQQILLGATPPKESEAALTLLENDLLNGDISAQTRQVIEKQLADPQLTGRKLDDPERPPNYGAIAGLIIGSPEFQKR